MLLVVILTPNPVVVDPVASLKMTYDARVGPVCMSQKLMVTEDCDPVKPMQRVEYHDAPVPIS